MSDHAAGTTSSSSITAGGATRRWGGTATCGSTRSAMSSSTSGCSGYSAWPAKTSTNAASNGSRSSWREHMTARSAR